MADIKLGPLGSEVALPAVCWPAGEGPDIPYDVENHVEEIGMLDGSIRFNFREHSSGAFSLDWDGLEWGDVEDILDIVTSRQALSFINEYTDGVSHIVAVKSYGHALKAKTGGLTRKQYRFSLTLKETKTP